MFVVFVVGYVGGEVVEDYGVVMCGFVGVSSNKVPRDSILAGRMARTPQHATQRVPLASNLIGGSKGLVGEGVELQWCVGVAGFKALKC